MAPSDSSQHRALFVPGSVIADRYEVIDAVGKGGMGMVLRVHDRALNNEVIALKLLYPHMAKDQTQFARFQNEVLIARRLSHPNVVRLFDFGSAGQGYYYITMEYVEGGSLSSRIYGPKHQRITFQESLEVLLEVCAGLSCAHAMGVVHRDLKPDNILLTTAGAVKLSDFGLARSVGTDKGLTQTGDTVGTPYYMAPEQLRGERPDHRVDIYSLGILAYELVVGQRPFLHDNYLQLAQKHFREPIPKFANKESGIPQWFQEFVERCSAKQKTDRFQSVDEAKDVLAAHLSDVGNLSVNRAPAVLSLYNQAPKPDRPWVRTAVVGASSVALLAGMGFAAVKFAPLEGIKSSIRESLGAWIASSEMKTAPVAETAESNSIDPERVFEQVRKGNLVAISGLFEVGAIRPDIKDRNGNFLIHVATLQGDLKMVELLLELGVDGAALNAQGKSALKIAEERGDLGITKKLRGITAQEKGEPVDSQVDVSQGSSKTNSENASGEKTQAALAKVRLDSNSGNIFDFDFGHQGSLEKITILSIHSRGLEKAEAQNVRLRVKPETKEPVEFFLSQSVGKEPKNLVLMPTIETSESFRSLKNQISTARFSLVCDNCAGELALKPRSPKSKSK